jgi:hypothetical protein
LAYGDGVAGGLAGPEAKRAARSAGPKIRKKRNFWIKIGFLNLPRLWKFVGDLGGILTWGFFLNSSRILKDFRKI